jgi:uncharacterized membrane protein YbjE (DUF340 family)
VAFLAAGLAIGFVLRRRTRLLAACDRLTTASLWVLLFVLGAWVGSDEQIMSDLRRLAFESSVICLGAVGGSLAVLVAAGRLPTRRPGSDQ